MRHRWPVLLATTAVLVAAVVPLRSLVLTPGSLAGLPRGAEATRGLVGAAPRLRSGRASRRREIVVDGGRPGAARTPAVHAAVERLAARLSRDPGGLRRRARQQGAVRLRRRSLRARVRRRAPRVRRRGVAAARRADPRRSRAGRALPGGGDGRRWAARAPQGVDFLARIYAFFPWLVLLVARADVRRPRQGVPVAVPAAQGDRPQRCSRWRRATACS